MRHIKRQKACIIEFEFDEAQLLSGHEFQRAGVCEHQRRSCWTSTLKEKAQINEVIRDFTVVLAAPERFI